MEEGRRAIKRWNQRWKDTPRKLLAGALVLLSVGLLVGLLPYIGPFVLAFCLAYLMRPLVRVLRRAFAKVPFGHGLATLVAMALVFGFIGAAVGALVSRLAQELLALARMAPETVRLVTAPAPVSTRPLSGSTAKWPSARTSRTVSLSCGCKCPTTRQSWK